MSIGFSFWDDEKMSKVRLQKRLYSFVNIPKIIELYTLHEELYNMNCMCFKKWKGKQVCCLLNHTLQLLMPSVHKFCEWVTKSNLKQWKQGGQLGNSSLGKRLRLD